MVRCLTLLHDTSHSCRASLVFEKGTLEDDDPTYEDCVSLDFKSN